VQKVLARSGLASRRTAEDWLRAGRIHLNGKPAQPGARALPGDRLQLDGKPLPLVTAPVAIRVLAYHKPEGEICSRHDRAGRPDPWMRLPTVAGRWIGVGRLDVNACGLLLFTNHGDLAHRLMHPRSGLEREYAVRVQGYADEAALKRLRRGVRLEDGPARFLRIERGGGSGSNRWFRVVLAEGRKREVHRLWESQGLRVSRLLRVRYGPVRLPAGSRPGDLREVSGEELTTLLHAAGLPP